MLTRIGSIFYPDPVVDAICITTNQVIKRNGDLVMGAGNAGYAKKLWPHLPKYFGEVVTHGVSCAGLCLCPNKQHVHVCAFPTKHDWRNPSDIQLIERSAGQLKWHTEHKGWSNVWLPPPGCGLGGLSWEMQVEPLLSSILDDRFTVIFY